MSGTTLVTPKQAQGSLQNSKHRQKHKNSYISQSHIKGTKLAPKGPYENEKHPPEKPYMRGNAPIYTHCTGYMLGTNADTRMASQEAVQDQK